MRGGSLPRLNLLPMRVSDKAVMDVVTLGVVTLGVVTLADTMSGDVAPAMPGRRRS
jgi:hypothetical protein